MRNLKLGALALSTVVGCGAIKASIQSSIDTNVTDCRNGFDEAIHEIFDGIDTGQLACESTDQTNGSTHIACNSENFDIGITSVADQSGFVTYLDQWANGTSHTFIYEPESETYGYEEARHNPTEMVTDTHFSATCNDTNSGQSVKEILESQHATLLHIAVEQNPSGE